MESHLFSFNLTRARSVDQERSHAPNRLRLRELLYAFLVGAAYYSGSKLGFALTFHPHPVSTLWPPNSILVAALLLAPTRIWWLLLLGALPAHLAVQLQSDVPLRMVLCWFTSNCCEALIGAGLIRRFQKTTPRFASVHEVNLFLICAVFAGPFLSSFVDSAFVRLNGWGGDGYWPVWKMRFFSNILAELTLVPFILTWSNLQLGWSRKDGRFKLAELSILGIGLFAVTFAVFNLYPAGPHSNIAWIYAPVPFLIWCAARFSARWLSASILYVTVVAIWGAVHGLGPFTRNSPTENAFSIQILLILISIPLYYLGAILQERNRAEQVIRESNDRLSLALDAAEMGTWDWKDGSSNIHLSQESRRILGLRENCNPDFEMLLNLVYPDDRHTLVQSIQHAASKGQTHEVEFRILLPNGETRWVMTRGEMVFDDSHNPVATVGIIMNITGRKRAEQRIHTEHSLREKLAGRLITAQEEERAKVARSLHDGVQQQVAAVSILLSRIKSKFFSPSQDGFAQFSEVQKKIRDIANDIRRASHDLHPGILRHAGLSGAVRNHCEEFLAQNRIALDLTTSGNVDSVDSETAVCLYRIIQEALTNVAKHSAATHVSISLSEINDLLTLCIRDDGRGFDPGEAKKRGGLGLISLDERIRLLHGELNIDSRPNKGTTLTASIPLGISNHRPSLP